jgi:hypothetical protein
MILFDFITKGGWQACPIVKVNEEGQPALPQGPAKI